jgi:hypothetical protein
MAETISVGAAVGSGFGLIRRKPLAVLAWSLVVTLALGVVVVAYVNFITNMMALPTTQGAGAQLSPSQSSAVIGAMLMGEGMIFLAFMVLVLGQTIVTTAVWRAVLHPEQGRWAYLRVGMAELFVFAIKIAVGFMANLVMFPLMPFMIVVGVLLAMHQYVAAIIVGVLAIIVLVVALIYIQLRFVLLGPMIVDDGKFHFLEAWRLSRGKVGSLFLTGLSVFGILLAAEVLLEVLAAGSGAAVLYLAAGGFDKLQALFQQPPAVIAGKLWPLGVIWMLGAFLCVGPLSAIMIAPWAKAYRDLAPTPTAVG